MELTERALQRRLKRHLMKERQDFLAVCTPGFEPELAHELEGLPEVEGLRQVRGGVEFSGPLDTIYHVNLRLRSANRLLMRLGEFLAQSYPMLFDHARKLPWELHLAASDAVAVRVSARKSRLRHQAKIAETVHSAMLRHLDLLGLHPALTDDAPIEINARVFQDRCTLSLNTSGEHLHRRGYRQAAGPAPIRETLAAGILRHLDWHKHDLILDPMCGSGTFLIEAALLARGLAPGRARAFAFEHLPYFQPGKWARFKREAEAEARPQALRLVGADLDPRAAQASRENAARAGVSDGIALQQGDALTLPYDELGQGASRPLVLSNLPYGERLGSEGKTRGLYQTLCDRLRDRAPGWRCGFVTSRPDWLKEAGFRVEEELPFTNGGLRVCLIQGTVR